LKASISAPSSGVAFIALALFMGLVATLSGGSGCPGIGDIAVNDKPSITSHLHMAKTSAGIRLLHDGVPVT
jgi:hypothetical protein